MTSHTDLGDILREAVKYQKVRNDLIQMLGSGFTDVQIQTELNVTLLELAKFKNNLKREKINIKVDKPDSTPPPPPEHEVDIDVFLAHVQEDVLVVSLYSYNHYMKPFVRHELARTRHARSSSGIMLERSALVRLARLAVSRMYPREILEQVRQHKIDAIALHTKSTDTKSLSDRGLMIKWIDIEVRESALKGIVDIYKSIVIPKTLEDI